jgi:hypothetical protein
MGYPVPASRRSAGVEAGHTSDIFLPVSLKPGGRWPLHISNLLFTYLLIYGGMNHVLGRTDTGRSGSFYLADFIHVLSACPEFPALTAIDPVGRADRGQGCFGSLHWPAGRSRSYTSAAAQPDSNTRFISNMVDSAHFMARIPGGRV